MKVVMTLTARDEADIINEQIAFHLGAGVDFIIAADNGSTDGTKEIFEKYAREGYVHLITVPDPFLQIELVTEMARRAATEFGADWVINSDADEFWWPRGGGLKEILTAVPSRFGSVRGMWRNFVARPQETSPFAEGMTVRWQRPVPGLHPFNTHFKTVHRASVDVTVSGGNHDVVGTGVAPLFGWYPIEVLHFPIRSLHQFERKFMRHWEITAVDGKAPNPFYNWVSDAHREGRIAEFYEPFVVDDDELARGLAEGTLAKDTRLRDALRALRSGATLPPSAADQDVDRGYLVELGYIEDNSQFARAQRSIDELETRVGRLERGITRRLSTRLSRRT